tara:strand:+ start:296 stop:595 length:300 start_codon:yes stop_codon:yes gene_type:complete
VSTGAFSKVRMKLSHRTFLELNDELIQESYDIANIDKWHGHRLLADDSSVTQLPVTKELFECYGKPSLNVRMSVVRLSQLYAVKNNIALDLQVQSYSIS